MKYFYLIKQKLFPGLVAAVASLLLSPGASAQTTKTVCSTGCDYTTIAAAVNWINNTSNSATGGVIFTIDSGHTETAPIGGIVITRQGTASDYIKFIKASGATVNPRITAPEGTGNNDAIITLAGADFITFDGIDIEEDKQNTKGNPNTQATKRMEFGFLIKSGNGGGNGATNNTIKNCAISLSNATRDTYGAIGILQTANSFGGGVSATNTAGTNSNNTYQNITISEAISGIYLSGTSAGYPDSANVIQEVTIDNIASATPAYGIRLSFQQDAFVSTNYIKNISGSGANTVSGVEFVNTAGTNTVSNNRIENVENSDFEGIVRGISITNTNASSVVNIYNNTITGLNARNNNASVTGLAGIYVTGSVAGTHNIYFNSILIDPSNNKCTNTCLEAGSVSTVNKIRNNILANFTGVQSSAKHYAIITGSSNSIGATGSVSSNNDLYIKNTSNGYIGFAGTDKTTLADWQAVAAGMDMNSITADPFFTSATDLHTSNCRLKARGIAVTGISADAFGITRSGLPSIGADEMANMVREGMWVGATSTEWLTNTNWCDEKLPTTKTNVFISGKYSNYPVISSGTAEANNIIIETGAKLTINGGNLNFAGTVTKNGSFDLSAGNLTLSGDSQVVPVTVATNLTILSPTVSLTSDLTVSGTLALLDGGILNTDTNKIILDTSASLLENDTSFIIGTVETHRTVASNDPESFSNIGLSINAAGNAPGITIVTRINTPAGIAFNGAHQGIQRSYDIKPVVDTGLNATVVFSYLDSELNGLPESVLQLYRSPDSGKTWQYVPSILDTSANTMTATGIYAFSIWTGGSSLAPLPVNLVTFNAARKNESSVVLNWETVGELNNDRFEVERSNDGFNFKVIGTIAGVGTSTNALTYTFEDNNASILVPALYYRLKQIDCNEAFEYSRIIKVTNGNFPENPDIRTWYNQADGCMKIAALNPESERIEIKIIDMQGRQAAAKTAKLIKGANNISVDIRHLNNGIYSYFISSQKGIYNGKIVKY